jgi:hypothetical protein
MRRGARGHEEEKKEGSTTSCWRRGVDEVDEKHGTGEGAGSGQRSVGKVHEREEHLVRPS